VDDLKMKVLQQLIDKMDSMDESNLKSKLMPDKVSVMADNPEDMKKGLDMASKVLPEMEDESSMDKESPMEDMGESNESDDEMKKLMEMYKKLS